MAMCSYAVFLTLEFIASVSSAIHLPIRATRIRGELHGMSTMRCKLLTDSHQIRHIEWEKGLEKGKSNYVYFDSTDPKARNATRKRGTFTTRNVSGLFIEQESAHELKIYGSVSSDEDVYTCTVWNQVEDRYSSQVNLTLNVQPKTAPSIQALDGQVLSTSDCNQPNVSVIRWPEMISLYCTVGEAKPPATIRWQNTSGGMGQYEEEFHSGSYEDGLQLFSVKRRVDNTLQHDEKFRCTVNVSKPEHDNFKVIELCVWIHLYDPPKAYKFSWIMNGVIVYVMVAFLSVWLFHRVLFLNTGSTGRLISHCAWYLSVLVFLANTFTILHIYNDSMYHVQLLKKYQTIPDDPYSLYHEAWFWFAIGIFSIRLLSGIAAIAVWKICYKKTQKNLDDLRTPLGNPDPGTNNPRKDDTPTTTSTYDCLKSVGCFIPRILLGPSILLYIDLFQKKKRPTYEDYDNAIAANVICVIHRIVFEALYFVNGIIIYKWSIPVRLTDGDGTSLQSPRIPTVVLSVVLVLDVVVNAIILLVATIKKDRGR